MISGSPSQGGESDVRPLRVCLYVLGASLKYSGFESMKSTPVMPIAERPPPAEEFLSSDEEEKSNEEDERYDHEYRRQCVRSTSLFYYS